MASVELATAYLSLVPSMKGAGKAISSELGSPDVMRGVDGAGGKAGKKWAAAAGKAVAAGAAVAGAAIAATTAYGIKEFAQFERGMNEVFTLLPGMSSEAMGKMQDDTRAFAREMGITANEVVPALYQSLSAGVPEENVFAFLEIAQKAAVGGVTDLSTAVDGISSVVNAYGDDIIDATQASDLMFTAVRLGKTDFEQLSSSLFNVTPTASALGVEFGDVTAALAALTAQGVPTSVATTQMRQLFVELSKDGGKAADVFEEMAGKSFKDFIASGGNVNDALTIMGEYAEQSGLGINDLFGSVEAGSAALALYDNEAFVHALDEMATAAGATETAYDQMDQGLARTWERIKASFNDAALEIGANLGPELEEIGAWIAEKLPGAIESLSTFLTGTLIPAIKSTVEWFKDAGAWIQRNRDWLSTLGVMVGTVAVAWGGYIALTQGIPAILTAIRAAQIALNLAMSANPIGLIITAIAALVAGLIWFFTETETGRKIVTAAWEGIKRAIGAVADWWTGTVWPKIERVLNWFSEKWDQAGVVVSATWDLIKKAAKAGWDWIDARVIQPFNKGLGWLGDKWDEFRRGASIAWDLLQAKLKKGWDWVDRWILTPFKVGLKILTGDFDGARRLMGDNWDRLQGLLRRGWDWIDSRVFAPFRRGIDRIRDAFDVARQGIGRTWDRIKEAAAKPINFVLGTVYNDGIRDWWNKVANAVGLTALTLPRASTVRFADGGVHENHVAQIAPAGAWRVWAEDETGGEAYIPLAASKRSRSTAILAEVADRFGYGLTAFNNGGFWDNVGGGWSKAWRGAAKVSGDVWDNLKGAAKHVRDFLKDPVGTVTRGLGSLVDKLLPGIGGRDLGKMAARLPKRFVGGLADAVRAAFGTGEVAGGPPVSGGVLGGKMGAGSVRGVAAMTAALRGIDPSARVTSGLRGGARTATGYPSYHGLGRAIDIVSSNMGRTWDLLRERYGRTAAELFYTPRGFLRFGKMGGAADITRRMHFSHVHWAMKNGGILGPKLYDQGGYLKPGMTSVMNASGKPEAVLTPAESAGLKAAVKQGPIDLSRRTIRALAEEIVRSEHRVAAGVLATSKRHESGTRSSRSREW